jgi:putative cell wall-binding protein
MFRNAAALAVAFGLMVAAVWMVAENQANAASSTPVVYVATGENFPDALGAGPVAALVKGPILLVRKTSIPSQTAAELTRLSPDKIIIVGGTAVISNGVQTALGAYASTVERIAGSNRYDTAAKLSNATYPASFATWHNVVPSSFTLNPNQERAVKAPCPAGKAPISGGGTENNSRWVIVDSAPYMSGSERGWTVSWFNTHTVAQASNVSVDVLCTDAAVTISVFSTQGESTDADE